MRLVRLFKNNLTDLIPDKIIIIIIPDLKIRPKE